MRTAKGDSGSAERVPYSKDSGRRRQPPRICSCVNTSLHTSFVLHFVGTFPVFCKKYIGECFYLLEISV